MSTSHRLCLSLVLGAPLLAGAGCASAGRQEAGAALEPVEIVVENTQPSGAALSVQIVSSTGERTLLGAVPPLGSETFRLDLHGDRAYRLLAVSPEGRRIVSDTFALGPGERVRWTVPFNSLINRA